MRHIPPGRACGAILLASCATSASVRAQPPAPPASAEVYASAATCAACHASIHANWSRSSHARAARSPAFLASLASVLEGSADKDAQRRACVWCHAPTTLVTGDYALEQPTTREGVTCDFCHTVADVELGRAGHPFDLRPGNVKRGPVQYAESSPHGMQYSLLHKTSSLLCASCHEYRSAGGAHVLSTYSEWKDSSYAERGAACQECHMSVVVQGGSAPRRPESSGRLVNQHVITGGSSLSQVQSGLELRLEWTRTGIAAEVQATVTNSGVGHAAPGGLATKALVLSVGVETRTGELMHRRERVYQRTFQDAQGRALSSVAELFVKATAVSADTRLKPREARTERFTVPLPEDAQAIVAFLEYRDASDPRAGTKTMMLHQERQALGGGGRQ